MDSSRGEKREVNPPTVYRPEAVYSAAIRSPVVNAAVGLLKSLLGLLTANSKHQAENYEADAGTEGKHPYKR